MVSQHQSEAKDIGNGTNARERMQEEEAHAIKKYDPKSGDLKQQQKSPMDNDPSKKVPDSIFHIPKNDHRS